MLDCVPCERRVVAAKLPFAWSHRSALDGQILTFAHHARLPTFDQLMQAPPADVMDVTQACRLFSQALGDTPTDCTKARENDAALA